MIREIEPRDLPALKRLQNGFEWRFGVDYLVGLVYVDAGDRAVAFAGAWRLAEVHLLVDPAVDTPGMRWAVVTEIHAAMEQRLRAERVGRAVTWMDGMRAFGRRLERLGWLRSAVTSWHRRIG